MAAGTNVMLLADTTAAICQLQALSPVGRCKTFDASADGYGRGEGFTVAILQRQGSHPALAILAASAVNQGGRSSGLTAPNGPAQTALVRSAMAAGNGIDPSQLGVVSIHGTGTPLGDPIEVGALTQALPRGHSGVAVISNKSCWGHTEGAAGLTGLLAAMGSLRHAALPAIMHLRDMNPYVTTALADWSRQRGGGAHSGVAAPRQRSPAPVLAGDVGMLTGTSSFGMSGVNAHALLSAVSDTVQRTGNFPVQAWNLQRTFVLAPAHALLASAVVVGAPHQFASFSCALSSSALTYLWDHEVSGVPCLPPAALLEMTAAANLLSSTEASAEGALISDATILAALQLPSTELAPLLSCSMQMAQGFIEIGAGGNQRLCSANIRRAQASGAVPKTLTDDSSDLHKVRHIL